jgi:hypothetical protein
VGLIHDVIAQDAMREVNHHFVRLMLHVVAEYYDFG